MPKRKKKKGGSTATKKRKRNLSSLTLVDLSLHQSTATLLGGKILDGIKVNVGNTDAKVGEPLLGLNRTALVTLRSRRVPASPKEHLLASLIVKNSVQEVLDSLTTSLDVKSIVTPSSISRLGTLAASRALNLADEYVSRGRYGRDMDMGSLIDAIASCGVEVAIGASGYSSVKVKPSSSSGGRRSDKLRGGLDSKLSQARHAVRQDSASVQQSKNGTIIINLYLNIHIDNKLVHQLIVNPKEFNNHYSAHPTSLDELVDKALSELVNNPEIIAQDSSVETPEPKETEPKETEPEKTEPEKTEPEKTESEESESEESESEETESEETN